MIETKRLNMHVATCDEMRAFIEKQTDEALKTAYLEMLTEGLKYPKQWEWYAMWMLELKDGTHVGDLCFKGVNALGVAEIGYGIIEKYRCNGYATEAADAAVLWALRHTEVNSVEAETDASNVASQKVLQKCGFKPNGVIGKEGPRFVKNSSVFEKCPILENESFLLRRTKKEDCNELMKVYGDKNALPFFNSDGCNGDNFYYCTKGKMQKAIEFWDFSYDNGYFARLSIVDKKVSEVIGTVELCLRVSKDAFNNMGILRVDVRSDYEEENMLHGIFALISPEIPKLLPCSGVLTKAPIYAIERQKALQKAGFVESENFLIGNNGYAYNGYYTLV